MSLPNPSMDFTPFDVLPAASLDDMVENIEALAAGTGLNDAVITPNKLDLDPLTAVVATSQSRTNAAYGDLATVGPAVTVTIGNKGLAIVFLSLSNVFNNTTNGASYMGFAISGANTVAAGDAYSIHLLATGGSVPQAGFGAPFLLTGLTPGSTTFTAKYRSLGSDTASFVDRRIAVIPL